MITMMKIMLKIEIIKNIYEKNQNPYEGSFLTITITLTTNKTVITDKTLATGEGKTKTKEQKNRHKKRKTNNNKLKSFINRIYGGGTWMTYFFY